MNNIPKRGTPLSTPMRPPQDTPIQEKEKNWMDTETAIEELKSIELIPLVLDIITAASSGTLKAQDAENAAGPIRVRLTKAREILRNIHGLAETPEERAKKVERLKKNISSKEKSLQKFRDLVGERISLSPRDSASPDKFGSTTITLAPTLIRTDTSIGPPSSGVTTNDKQDDDDVEMIDEPDFTVPSHQQGSPPLDISGIEDIPNVGEDQDIQME